MTSWRSDVIQVRCSAEEKAAWAERVTVSELVRRALGAGAAVGIAEGDPPGGVGAVGSPAPAPSSPRYEHKPKDCPRRASHNSLRVCPLCGADSAN